jgi:hypothetical protein
MDGKVKMSDGLLLRQLPAKALEESSANIFFAREGLGNQDRSGMMIVMR